MLKPKNRLRKMKDFDILFKEGRFVNDGLITLKFWQIEPEKYPKRDYSKDDLRLGFVVGLKVSKSAVKRNRVKRQMREVVRLILKEDKLKLGFHTAFIAKPGILDKEYDQIEENIMNLLKKANILV